MFGPRFFLYLTGFAGLIGLLYGTAMADSCDLRCWLANLQLNIPDQSFNFTWLLHTYYVNMSNITCLGVSLGEIDSELDLEANSVSLSMYGLGTWCHAQWIVEDQHGRVTDYQNGSLVAIVSNSSIGATLVLNQNELGLASSANLTNCFTSIIISELEMTGGDLADKIDQIVNETTAALEKAIDRYVCTELTSLVSENLTAILQELNAVITPYLYPQPAPVLASIATNAMNMQTSAFVNMLDYIMDDLVGTDGILGLNVIFNTLTNNTGICLFYWFASTHT